MKRKSMWMLCKHAGLSGLAVAFSCAATAQSTAQVQRYVITPGSEYTFLPSPEGPGIPGGNPSQYELDFGVTGLFSVEYVGDIATLLNLDLDLSGNEMIQEEAASGAPVTAEGVADFLEGRQFEFAPDLEPFDVYTHISSPPYPPGFLLTDFGDGSVSLVGGVDTTAVDGLGWLFDWNAVVIPEPGTLALAAIAAAFAIVVGRSARTAGSRRAPPRSAVH